jgi:type II secretory pathway pseudopilin PulG
MRAFRFGLTLVEVILVLALLVVVGAVTVPVLSGSITQARLQHSGDLVRAAWGKADAGRPVVCLSL